jgi:uncharacterized protein (UPF0335 family)
MPKIKDTVEAAGVVEDKSAAAAKPGHNGKFKPDDAKTFVTRIENLHADLEAEKSAYMLRCKSIREDIAEVYGEAVDKNVPKKELRKVVKARELERRAKEQRDQLDADQQETFDQIRFALGDLADLPLGNAALQSAGADALNSLTH